MRTTSLFLLSACLAFATGCGRKPEEKLVEKAVEAQLGDEAEVKISKDSISIKSQDGKMKVAAGKAATIPKDFPSDIHIYPKSTVEGTVDVPTGKMVTLATKDDVGTVFGVYKKEMNAKGWKEQTTMNLEGQAVLTLRKTRRAVNVTITKDEKTGGSRIMLMLPKQ